MYRERKRILHETAGGQDAASARHAARPEEIDRCFPEKRVLANPDTRLVGIEKVDGQDAYRIDVPGEMVQASYFYDVDSGLKLKETSTVSINGQTHTQEVFFRDYEDRGGLRFPGLALAAWEAKWWRAN